MDPEIRPEPSPQERMAILVALERLFADGGPPAYRSGWREAGIRENLDEREAADYRATARPCSSPGATRA